jgi:hypothetical protein
MTTFTTEDLQNVLKEEGIPFAGWVKINDDEDTIKMLREQLSIVQAECQRLRKILMENGIND